MRKVTQIKLIIECEVAIVVAQIALQRTPDAAVRDRQLEIILEQLALQRRLKKEW